MSTMTRNTAETSVTFSLAELARIEEERVRAEEDQRRRARERQAREQREAEAQRRAAEVAQVAAEAEARARRTREEAEHRARAEARERALADVARIEAEAKAHLEAENALRAHELAALRVRAETGGRRLSIALAAVLAVVLCAGSAAAYRSSRRAAAMAQDVERLREGQQALARERDSARETEFAALDRRYAVLRAEPLLDADALATAEAARKAVDPKVLDHDRLRAFGDALDVLQARLALLERLRTLDRRHADLVAWAGSVRKSEAAATAKSAAALAKALSTEEAVRTYERALDRLRHTLVQPAAGKGSPVVARPAGQACTDPHDPMCDINGHRIQ